MSEEVVQGKKGFPAQLLIKLTPFLAFLIIGIIAAVTIVRSRPEILGLTKGPGQIQAESDALVAEVGKLIELPADEKPTVTTLTDSELERVKDQPFFRNARKDDRVIVYNNARKAIIYRPAEKRIIEVGAVNINEASPVPTPEVEEEKSIPTPEPEPTPESTP